MPECRHCGNEACTRPCDLCRRHRHDPFELAVCWQCAADVRQRLHRVEGLYRVLPVFIPHLSAQRLDRRRSSNEPVLPGGDHLVFLGPGSDAANRLRAFLAGLDDAWDQDDRPTDPTSVAFALAAWEDDWRRVRHEPAATDRGTVATAAAYLHRWHDWAAQHHPEFTQYASDLGRLKRHLERVTSTSEHPEAVNATCLDCGERLQRKMTKGGFADDANCPGCGRVYGQREYFLAARAFLQARADARSEAS